MKITIHPDGRIEREGTPEELRAYDASLQLSRTTGQFLHNLCLNAACQPWNMGQVWVGEIKAPMVTMYPPPGAAAACAPSWH